MAKRGQTLPTRSNAAAAPQGVLDERMAETGDNWRLVYKSLLLLEYMVKHGPVVGPRRHVMSLVRHGAARHGAAGVHGKTRPGDAQPKRIAVALPSDCLRRLEMLPLSSNPALIHPTHSQRIADAILSNRLHRLEMLRENFEYKDPTGRDQVGAQPRLSLSGQLHSHTRTWSVRGRPLVRLVLCWRRPLVPHLLLADNYPPSNH